MPRPQNKQPREIVVRSRKLHSGTRYDAYQQMAVLFAACGIEQVPVYLKEDKNGQGVTLKLYCPDDPISCWVELYDDLEGQLKSLILQVWGKDTYREAEASVVLGSPQTASGTSETEVPPQGSRRGTKAP